MFVSNLGAGTFTVGALSLVLALSSLAGCHGHGLVEYPAARNQFCGVVTKPEDYWTGNAEYPECFAVFDFGTSQGEAYQFMSVLSNGPGRGGDNPLPTNVCGYDSLQFSQRITPWDAYGVDWPVNDMSPGRNEFRWNIQWGSHFTDTMEFVHYITKSDFVYDPNQPLDWNDFEDEPFCVLDYNDNNPTANPDVIPLKNQAKFETYCDVPFRAGRHVIYAEWGRRPPSSDERFHGCIDVEFPGGLPPPTSPPPTTSPPTNGTPTNPSPPTPTNAPVQATEPPTPDVSQAECAIDIQDGANPHWAGLQVGFDTPTITLDFSATGLDLADVTVQQGVFTSLSVSGNRITLGKPNWVSLTNKGYLGFNGNGVPELANLVAPDCINV